jgi:hypothetical protein
MTASREAPVTEDYATKRCVHSSCAHIVFRDQDMSGGKIPCRSCGCTDHRTRPASGEHDPLTPPGAEAALESFQASLEEATRLLAQKRNEELDAEDARDTARRRAQLSPDAPKVGVFDGIRTTVAMREAWVQDQIAEQEHEYRLAREARRAAADHLRKIEKQGSFQQSISRSVSTDYQGTGGGRW